MPKIKYMQREMNSKRLKVVAQVNAILEEFALEGIHATVRQIFYQFVARELVKNTLREYKNLASVIDMGRLTGLIDWDAIQDRTRFLRGYSTFENPQAAIDSACQKYIEDLWRSQEHYIEVWIEKDAALGSIEQVCREWRLPYLSCRGYFSQSEMWEAGQRFLHKSNDQGKECHIFHFGDHDPSGIDMSRDIQERLDLFSYPDCVTVHRLALTYKQVKIYNPPPNFAKQTDSRHKEYVSNFGEESWELDALHPRVIRKLIEGNLKNFLDEREWKKVVAMEKRNKTRLQKVGTHYEELLKSHKYLR